MDTPVIADQKELCADIKCSLENVPGAMEDRDRWRERERERERESVSRDTMLSARNEENDGIKLIYSKLAIISKSISLDKKV